MKLNIARVSALGTIGLGLMSLALTGGCAAGGGDPNPSSSEAVGKSAQAVITPVSLTTNGCGAVGTFAITSPQVISFIAANTSAFANSQLQLYTMDSEGHQTQVNKTAQQASASMLALLISSSKSSASNTAMADQTATTGFENNASAKQYAKEQDKTTVSGNQSSFATSDTTVTHEDSHNTDAYGTAANLAFNSASADSQASGSNGSRSSADQNLLSNQFQSSLVPIGFFGGVVVAPSSSSAFLNNINSSDTASKAFFQNQASASQQGAAANISSFSNHTHSDNSSTDTADLSSSQGSEFSQTVMHNLDSASGTSSQASGSSLTDLSASSSNTAKQSADNFSLQSNASQSSASTFVYTDLDTFNSSNYLLVVTMTAKQANSMLQLFQGSNGVVTGNQSFPIAVPTCGN